MNKLRRGFGDQTEALDVLKEFGDLGRPLAENALEIKLGFSGAVVWKVPTPRGIAALRRWPTGTNTERVSLIHRLMRFARQSGLSVIPQPMLNAQGESFLPRGDVIWDLCTWRPGAPLAVGRPHESTMREAATTLARWHAAFDSDYGRLQAVDLGPPAIARSFIEQQRAPSPGMKRRRTEWDRLQRLVEEFSISPSDPLSELAGRTVACVQAVRPAVERWLRDADRSVRMAVCLRDVHREHLLFQDGKATGLIDFGAVGLDSPACDLARWLGSVAPDDRASAQVTLEAYRGAFHLDPGDEAAIASFDRVGCVVGALHWWEWRVLQKRSFPNFAAADARWSSHLDRIESWLPANNSFR